MEQRRKDPDSKLDFGFDWNEWLSDGETIAESSWSVAPNGDGDLSFMSSKNGANGYVESGKALCWVESGRLGETYMLTNRITTSAGRVDDRSFEVLVTER